MDNFRHYIGGEWIDAAEKTQSLNPSDISDIVGLYAEGNPTLVNDAVNAAQAAFSTWASSTPHQRFQVLDFIGNEIISYKDELGRLLSREEGKTLPEGIGEVERAGYLFKFFAGEALRPGGELIPSVRPGVDVHITREPVGVVGLITPWNFPIAIPAWKIAPALAFGNAVVFKPAELVPALAFRLAEIISRSPLPKGVFNMIYGAGETVGAALVEHRDVRGISFTGSVEVARLIMQKCAARGARVQCEMGGKNPLVVLDDADLDVAVHAAVQGAYYSTGQRCTASSRLIVTQGIHDRFVAALTEKLRRLKIGDATAAGTDIGPVVDDLQLNKDLDYISVGRQEGAHLAFGGQRLSLDKNGYYLAPALFTQTTQTMRINREEIFGPVASVIAVLDYDEALAVANDTTYGLTAGICTTSLKYATHFRRHAEAGMVMVNLPTAGVDYHVPFGGRKHSNYGPREQGRYAAEFYTIVKTAYVAS
jgi:aldehyde dehydrogenase (NAD+)